MISGGQEIENVYSHENEIASPRLRGGRNDDIQLLN